LRISHGRYASHAIEFSAIGRAHTRLKLSFFSSRFFIIYNAAALHAISSFIPYIPSHTLIFSHPVSKVIPFPTIQKVGSFLSTIFSKITSFGFEVEAFPTASNSQSQSLLISS